MFDSLRQFYSEKQSEALAHQAGIDCAMNGLNESNCHLSFFARPELTKAWEQGKAKGDAIRQQMKREAVRA